MLAKVAWFISTAGLALLLIPEQKAPPPDPEISATLAIRDAPKGEKAGEAANVDAPPAADHRPDAIKNLRITKEISVTRWLGPGEYVWSVENAAQAQGPATVVVNLRSRTLSLYRGGVELGRAHILYGFGEHPTPLGTFPVREKKRDHHSRTYNAPMPFMLRLTDDGVALHGSARHANDLATHGCIGQPPEFAALLFEHVNPGDQVVIWSGKDEG